MLDQGMKPPEIAAELGCSATYVRVCRMRARIVDAGMMRSRDGIVKALSPDERKAYHQAARAKGAETRRHRRQVLSGQQERARARSLDLAVKRAIQQKEIDDMIASSINRRRAHVNRILQAWKETA